MLFLDFFHLSAHLVLLVHRPADAHLPTEHFLD